MATVACKCGRPIPLRALKAAFAKSVGLQCSACNRAIPANKVIEGLRCHLRGMLKKGDDCPGCGHFAKRYNRKLNSGIARWLVALVRLSPNGEWIDPGDVTKSIGHRVGQDATTLLPSWGLIESCSICQRSNGRWRPTDSGRDFAAGKIKVPRTIFAYNRQCLGHDTVKGDISIREALGEKFDYDELMRALG